MSKIKIAFGVVALSLVPIQIYAQSENIFLVKMFDCANKPAQRSQTGFRVRGTSGIITALHGVADCQRITVKGNKELMLFDPLKIIKIDIEHDVALLSSSELESKNQLGLEPSKNTLWNSLDKVRVYGHPYGIGRLDTSLNVRDPSIRPLKDLIPSEALSNLRLRNSPNPLINVLSLQGNILPGHSGAPVLDSQGRLIAVANGGLQKGQAGISWAIPFEDIDWESANSNKRFLSLTKPEVESLFVFDDGLPDLSNAVIGTIDDFCVALNKVVEASRIGFISIVGKPQLGDFQPKIEIPGSSYSSVRPRIEAIYLMFKSDQRNIIESEYYNLVYKLTTCLPKWEQKEFIIEKGQIQSPGKHFELRDRATGTKVETEYDFEPFLGSIRLWLYVYAPNVK